MLPSPTWEGCNTEYFDMKGKRKPAATEGVKVWADPGSYRRFLAGIKSALAAKAIN